MKGWDTPQVLLPLFDNYFYKKIYSVHYYVGKSFMHWRLNQKKKCKNIKAENRSRSHCMYRTHAREKTSINRLKPYFYWISRKWNKESWLKYWWMGFGCDVGKVVGVCSVRGLHIPYVSGLCPKWSLEFILCPFAVLTFTNLFWPSSLLKWALCPTMDEPLNLI